LETRPDSAETGLFQIKEQQMKRHSLVILLLVILGGISLGLISYARSPQQAKKWPPQFPRAGATKVFENDRVIVWDQVYTTTEFMHKHTHDLLVIAVQDGPIKVVTPEGQTTVSEHVTGVGPNFKIPGVQGWFPAGLGPHSEMSTDPSRPRRAFFIEFKGTEPKDCKLWSLAC
jgi:hypothetical protein